MYYGILSFSIGSIGPVTTMPSFIALYPELDNQSALGAIVATVSAIAYPSIISCLTLSQILMSASLASLAGGWCADKFSRKRTISLGAFVFATGAALEAGTHVHRRKTPCWRQVPHGFMFNLGPNEYWAVGEGLFLSAIGGTRRILNVKGANTHDASNHLSLFGGNCPRRYVPTEPDSHRSLTSIQNSSTRAQFIDATAGQ